RCGGASFSSMCAPNELISTGTDRSQAVVATSSNSMIIVSQSMPMPPWASLTTPETRPNEVNSRMIPAIVSRGTNRSRYCLLKIGSILSSRKRFKPSTAACCSGVLNTYPMSFSWIAGGLRRRENRDGDHGFLDAVEAAAVFLDGDARLGDLALAGFA